MTTPNLTDALIPKTSTDIIVTINSQSYRSIQTEKSEDSDGTSLSSDSEERARNNLEKVASKGCCCALPILGGKTGTSKELKAILNQLMNNPQLLNKPFDEIKKHLTNFSLTTIETALNRRLDLQEVAELSKLQSLINTKIPSIVLESTQIGTIESLRYCFQLFAADHLPNNSFEAMQTLQVYLGVVLLPFFFTTLASGIIVDLVGDFFPNFHFVPSLMFLSIILIAGTGYTSLKIYDKFRPLPSTIRPLTNYTTQALSGRIEPLLGRDDIIEKVFLSWQSTHSSVRQHPLLVGPAGVGKTVILIEIARRLATGEVPEGIKTMMKGKQVLGGVASLLLPASDNMGGMADVLERFLRQIRPYRKDIIVALDEIHALMREPRYAETLKSALDTSIGGLPYVIGATTDEEYQEYIASDPARARRFNVIFVDALNKTQVMTSLKEMVRRQYPNVTVTAQVLNHLYQECEDLCKEWRQNKQPEIGKRILSQAISVITLKQQDAPSAKLLPSMFIDLDNLKAKYLQNMTENKYANDIAKLKKEIATIQANVASERCEFENYQKISEQLEKCRKKIISLAVTIQSARDNKRVPNEATEKMLLFCLGYLLPLLERKQKNLRTKLRIPGLNKSLITKLIQKYKDELIAAGSLPSSQLPVKTS